MLESKVENEISKVEDKVSTLNVQMDELIKLFNQSG